jgi:hypothetical protein
MLALIRTIGPVAAMLIGIAGGSTLVGAGAWAFNEWIDNPHVHALATQKERDAATIRVMDAANRAEVAERARQRAVLDTAVAAYEAALDAGDVARRAAETARDQERADYEQKLRDAGLSDLVTDGDFDWLRRPHGPARR